ncbi:MAG: Holliday junction branch migration protein RuvA [Clostridium sp.]|nr:Holliday junction branch migration protein RuvA [Clostridium sp.]
MYSYIKGIFTGISKDYVNIENNEIGYMIYTSGSTMAAMPKIGEKVKLYIIQIVRDDFIGLYGFLTEEEKEMFNQLLVINGVGAKACLSLLSICSVTNLKYAIATGDEKTITRAPGIGKKTAQRIILELREKMQKQQFSETISGNDDMAEYSYENDKKVAEATGALISLGYSEKEAEKAMNSCDKSESIENIIKSSLKFLMN